MLTGKSPFKLLYEVEPRPSKLLGGVVMTKSFRKTELLALLSPRAARDVQHVSKAKKFCFEHQVWQLILYAYENLYNGLKWPHYKDKFYSPCTMVSGYYPRYALLFST